MSKSLGNFDEPARPHRAATTRAPTGCAAAGALPLPGAGRPATTSTRRPSALGRPRRLRRAAPAACADAEPDADVLDAFRARDGRRPRHARAPWRSCSTPSAGPTPRSTPATPTGRRRSSPRCAQICRRRRARARAPTTRCPPTSLAQAARPRRRPRRQGLRRRRRDPGRAAGRRLDRRDPRRSGTDRPPPPEPADGPLIVSTRRRAPGDARRRSRPASGTIWTTVALDLVGFGIVAADPRRMYAERFGASASRVGLLFAVVLAGPARLRAAARAAVRPHRAQAGHPHRRCSAPPSAASSPARAGALWLLFVGRIIDGASGGSVSVAQACGRPTSPRPSSGRACSGCSARRSASASCSARRSAASPRWAARTCRSSSPPPSPSSTRSPPSIRLPETPPRHAGGRVPTPASQRAERRRSLRRLALVGVPRRRSPSPRSRRRSRCSASAASTSPSRACRVVFVVHRPRAGGRAGRRVPPARPPSRRRPGVPAAALVADRRSAWCSLARRRRGRCSSPRSCCSASARAWPTPTIDHARRRPGARAQRRGEALGFQQSAYARGPHRRPADGRRAVRPGDLEPVRRRRPCCAASVARCSSAGGHRPRRRRAGSVASVAGASEPARPSWRARYVGA